MFRHRTAAPGHVPRRARAVFAGTAPLLLAGAAALTGVTAGPAYAHGAPTDPLSRVAACGPEGGAAAATDACRAAVAANDGRPFDEWDNLRLAGVDGRDRQSVPDGRLCSGGLDAYKGLDIARTDWPATELRPGASFTLTYKSTIPHEGTFSLYLTREGYSPDSPLTWDDLAPQPFASATDPQLEGGAYRISGTLPSNRTGRHVLYTIWRNTSTPDTYYSCSDVVFPGDGGAGTGSAVAADGANDTDGGTGQAAGQPVPSAPQQAATLPVQQQTSAAPPPTPSLALPSPTQSTAETAAQSATGAPLPSETPADATSDAPLTDAQPVGAQTDYAPVAAGGLAIVAGIAVFLLRRKHAAG
ncbi:lytic polysaccharide monooxygenase auxiliary activity family 9 protein [Streptomyces paludis]|uniref:Chitin-binding protein n=1 Tax=Streptomyces paludis TaxID=2282738 RepID=A0A345HXJ8_9ACTN|nr:lytic polysaccharide monooxygenase [Streptomyces paludis]AXG81422.1 chitin-binding protein [Streptomyces paludis]